MKYLDSRAGSRDECHVSSHVTHVTGAQLETARERRRRRERFRALREGEEEEPGFNGAGTVS